MRQLIPLDYNEYYHIYNRGNNKENLFREDANYYYFLSLWKKYIVPIADTYAYCLMPNHFHAMVKIKDFEASEVFKSQSQTSEVLKTSEVSGTRMNKCEQQFSNLFNAYSKAFNKKYNRTGKLFADQCKRKNITDDAYFTQLIYYIHANAQKHGFIDDFRIYPHSSYLSFLSYGNTSLMRNEVLEWFGGRQRFKEYHLAVHEDLKNLEFE